MEVQIWTSRGLMPESELVYSHEWEINPEYIKFREFYTASDGEIVKDSTHAYVPTGIAGATSIGQF